MAFLLYYIGFAWLTFATFIPLDVIDFAGIFIFLPGSYLNTVSELQQHFWKKKQENEGKLYTKGLFH